MNLAERRLWSNLRLRQMDGWKFRRQAPIGDYVVDFVCLAARLVIELDGPMHDDVRFEYDQRRQAWLESQGYKILRFSADHQEVPLEIILQTIYVELEQVPARFAPPAR